LLISATAQSPVAQRLLSSADKFLYDEKLSWLVDVECYSRIFCISAFSYILLPPFCALLTQPQPGASITCSLLPDLAAIFRIELNYIRSKLPPAYRPSSSARAFLFKIMLLVLRSLSFSCSGLGVTRRRAICW
jgi:hypothetical protein